MRRATILICAAALVLVSPSAEASWQFTKWGMTTKQVIAAGKDIVATSAVEAADNGSPTIRALLKMKYTAGEFGFEAFFRFTESGKLFDVALRLTSGDPRALSEQLRTKYGKPDSEKAILPAVFQTWFADGDEITLFRNDEDHACQLTYRARTNEQNKGL